MAFGSAQFARKDGKISDSVKASPWPDPHQQDARQRVVGWRNGTGISKGEQEKILKDDREAQQQYLDSKKAIAQGRLKDIQEPLAGLPPTWQAFWSTVPGLDAQAAYRAYQREEAKREKAQKVAKDKRNAQEALAGKPKPVEAEATTAEGEEAILAEIAKLETDVRQKKQALVECQRRVDAWDIKLANARQMDREEEVAAKRLKRTMDSASFKHGILQGKIGSSDTYFQYLQEDHKKTHFVKMSTLQRSRALMHAQIGGLKNEMRGLLKVAQDQLPSHTADEESGLGTPSLMDDDRLSRAPSPSGSGRSKSPTSPTAAKRTTSPMATKRNTSPIGKKGTSPLRSPIADD